MAHGLEAASMPLLMRSEQRPQMHNLVITNCMTDPARLRYHATRKHIGTAVYFGVGICYWYELWP